MSEKTHAEIVAEMRKIRYSDEVTGDFAHYADQLEAAHKREIDALKQRRAELNAEIAAKDEVIQRLDAEVRKYQEERELRIAAQKAKAAAEGYADGKRDAQVGNAARLREAVIEARRFVFAAMQGERYILVNDGINESYVIRPKVTLTKIDAALAATARNCEVGTAEEQLKRFEGFCRMISKDENCDGCPLPQQCATLEHCTLAWAQLPYESEAAK